MQTGGPGYLYYNYNRHAKTPADHHAPGSRDICL